MKKLLYLILIALLTQSCGTFFPGGGRKMSIYGGQYAAVKIEAEPQEVEVYVDGEKYVKPEGMRDKRYAKMRKSFKKMENRRGTIVDDPSVIHLKKKKKSREISVRKEGYREYSTTLNREFNPNTLWNILNFGQYFILIDLPFRGYQRYDKVSIDANLSKDPDHRIWDVPETVITQNEEESEGGTANSKTESFVPKSSSTSNEDISFLSNYRPSSEADRSTKVTQKTLLSRQALYHSTSFNDEKNLLAYARKDQVMEIRDMQTAQQYYIDDKKDIDKVEFSNKGNYIAATTSWDNIITSDEPEEVHLFDINTKEWLWSSSDLISVDDDSEIKQVAFSPSEEKVAILYPYELFIIDIDSGRLEYSYKINEFNRFKFPAEYFFMEDLVDVKMLSNTSAKLVGTSLYTKFKPLRIALNLFLPVFNATADRENTLATISVDIIPSESGTGRLKKETEKVEGIEIPPYVPQNTFVKGDYIFTYMAHKKTLAVLQMSAAKPTYIEFPVALADIEVDGRGIMYYALSSSSKVYRYDINSGTQLPEMNSHVAPVSDIELSEDNGWIISADANGIKNFWNLDGELLFRLYSDERDEYIVINDDNYYFGSKSVLNEVRILKDLSLYQFESFDLKFNRPDLVLKKMGSKNEILISNYENSYQRRLDRSGLDASQFTSDIELPKAELLNKKDLSLSTSRDYLNLKVKAEDYNHALTQWRVTVNGVQAETIDLKGTPYQDERNIRIKLSSGENFIAVSVINAAGSESLQETHTITSTKSNSSRVYYVGIGVSEYQQTDYNLQYAAKDIQDMNKALKDRFGRNYTSFILTNEEVTRENILSLKSKLRNVREDDIVIVSLSGHGLLDVNYDFYYATHDIDFMDPSSRGFAYEEIESLLEGSKSRNKLILMDACHSGEIAAEDAQMVASANTEKVSAISFRGIDELQKVSKKDNVSTFQLMKDTFTDISYINGTHIIAAASGYEYALESDEWKNGVFTYSFIKGLNNMEADLDSDGQISVNELREYVYQNVVRLTEGQQVPTTRKENLRNNFIITDQ